MYSRRCVLLDSTIYCFRIILLEKYQREEYFLYKYRFYVIKTKYFDSSINVWRYFTDGLGFNREFIAIIYILLLATDSPLSILCYLTNAVISLFYIYARQLYSYCLRHTQLHFCRFKFPEIVSLTIYPEGVYISIDFFFQILHIHITHNTLIRVKLIHTKRIIFLYFVLQYFPKIQSNTYISVYVCIITYIRKLKSILFLQY